MFHQVKMKRTDAGHCEYTWADPGLLKRSRHARYRPALRMSISDSPTGPISGRLEERVMGRHIPCSMR